MRVALISIFDNVKLSIDFINKIGEELGKELKKEIHLFSFIIFLYRCNGGQYGSQEFLRNQQFYIQLTLPINDSGLLYSAVSRLWTMLVCSALIDFTRSAHTTTNQMKAQEGHPIPQQQKWKLPIEARK